MRYTVSIEIAQPRERVVGLLADPVQMPKWLRGMVLHEPVSGEHGQVGTRSRVVMRMGRQEMEAVETITRREPVDLSGFPGDGVVHYEREIVAEGMWSAARERFTEAGPDATVWVSENEYRFGNVPMRLLGQLMRRSFRRQSLRHMQDFRAFAERGTDVRDTEGRTEGDA